MNLTFDDVDWSTLARQYRAQGEFVAIEAFLPAGILAALLEDVDRVRPDVHRAYLPGYKKSGSVGYHDLARAAPATVQVYEALAPFVSRVSGRDVHRCPDDDPHACAIYFYSEPGDHIGFHYDTSHYAGERFTVLIGLVNRSGSALECHLHTKEHALPKVELSIRTDPGTVVLFNGDTVWHRVTPVAAGEERISLSLEYVTSPRMSPIRRVVSNLKDAIAYFGFAAVFGRRQGRSAVSKGARPS
jgi:hypothetical protein